MSNQMIEVTDEPDVSANDYVVARNIAEKLHQQYPGHLWAVTCDGKTGIATVRNMALSGNWGFVIKLKDLFGDTQMKCVVKAGGEILERYNLRRGMLNQERVMEIPLMANGLPVFDYHEAKTKAPEHVVSAFDGTNGNPRELILPAGVDSAQTKARGDMASAHDRANRIRE